MGRKERKIDLFTNMTATDKLIVCCVRNGQSFNKRQVIAELLKEPIDWNNLLAEAGRHGVLSFLYQALKEVNSNLVPKEVKVRLKNAYLITLARSTAFFNELTKILQKFEEEGVENIVLKGPLYDERIYFKPGLRYYSDLDLLIKREDLDQAIQSLEELGYSFLKEDWALFEKEGKTQFHLQKGLFLVDLHWDLINNGSYRAGINLKLEEIWSKAQPLNFGHQKVLTLSIEDLILHECLHLAAHHAFEKLIWFKDIDQTVLRYKNQFNWDKLVARAKKMQIKTYVYYTFYFAKVLLGTEIPEEVLAELKPRYFLARIFELFCFRKSLLKFSKNSRSFSHQVWKILRDQQKERFKALLLRIFPPVEWYLHYYPLLPQLKKSYYYPLYPLLMGVRLFKRPSGSS